MGGSSYSGSVGSSSRGSLYSTTADTAFSRRNGAHVDVLPKDRRVHTDARQPIVICLDVTGSMGNAAKIMYDKMPMLWGQIEQLGYLDDFAISFCCVGDSHSDDAPLQVTQFERGTPIHAWLKKLWLEGGGGGSGEESYDLAASFYVSNCDMPNAEHPFFFFVGDEAPYETSNRLPTAPIFEALKARFDTFFIHWPYDGGSAPSTDRRIVAEWRVILGERLLILTEPKAIVDVILGLIAMRRNARDLAGYAQDMRSRGQTQSRIDSVSEAIGGFSGQDLIIV